LSSEWKNYVGQEDTILKRAYLAGFPHARYALRGSRYEVDFKRMTQKNLGTGKERQIRPPYTWKGKAPKAPVMAAGPTFCVTVPEGSAGTTIQVPHPKAKGSFVAVRVPATAHAGQTMLVPMPAAADGHVAPPGTPTAPAAAKPPAAATPATPPPVPAPAAGKKGSWTTGEKVAVGVAAAGAAVGGVVLGSHIAEEGWEGTLEDLGDVATDVGEGIADGAEATVDWVGDAGEKFGDFITDLF
jgi:hypothetical protein